MYKDLEASFQRWGEMMKEDSDYTKECLSYFSKYQTFEKISLAEFNETKIKY